MGLNDRGREMAQNGGNKIAVIGCGNLGGALIRGIVQSGLCERRTDVIACEVNSRRLEELVASYGVRGTADIKDAVAGVATVILAVKPGGVPGAVQEICAVFSEAKDGPVLISIAAGVPLSSIQKIIGGHGGAPRFATCRVMPNLACTVGAGLSVIYSSDPLAVAEAQRIFSAVGSALVAEREDELDIATGLSASAPAFFFVAMEALADGAVRMGLSRALALKMAAEAVMGSGVLAVKLGEHPAILKDMVASPGGTTIAGLQLLERGGFRGMLSDAVVASIERAREIRNANG